MNDNQQEVKSYTGWLRERKTSWKVKAGDISSKIFITAGGLSTIVAVGVMCVFLVLVVLPLFSLGEVSLVVSSVHDFPWLEKLQQVIVDEQQKMGVAIDQEGWFRMIDLQTGKVAFETRPFGEKKFTSLAFLAHDHYTIFGFSDGSIQLGTLKLRTQSFDPQRDAVYLLSKDSTLNTEDPNSQWIPLTNGIAERIKDQDYRAHLLDLHLEDPILLEQDKTIQLVDISCFGNTPIIAAYSSSGIVYVGSIRKTKNLLTGKITIHLSKGHYTLPSTMIEKYGHPQWLMLSGIGDNVYLIWPNGQIIRLYTRDPERIFLAEQTTLVPEKDAQITAVSFLLGKTSLLSGDSQGRIRVWFRIKKEGDVSKEKEEKTGDHTLLVKAHELPPAKAAVSAFAASSRSRMIAVGDIQGNVYLYYVTSNRQLLKVEDHQVPGGITSLTIAPKENGLYVYGKKGKSIWHFRIPHPEVSWKVIFGKVWYEGYTHPEWVWQSSSATDDFEPKYSLIPLIFGTLKATLFSMIFAVPLAILAAIYTSEIMHPKIRSKIKSTIEMMASLPSVVLGFLAALVVAPFAEKVVPSILGAFFIVPFTILLGSFLWQLLPESWQMKAHKVRLIVTLLFSLLGLKISMESGPLIDRIFFEGDIKHWLVSKQGSGIGGWMIVILPSMVLLMVWVNYYWILPKWRKFTVSWTRIQFVWAELGRFLLYSIVCLLGAWVVSWIFFHGLGWDPRGTYIDTYVQRNALIVGFMMGFAIIPIIYTLTEDALQSVPRDLRAASLGCGATPWQTATRIIVPTAGSGIFSALMVGLGRSVGETMIVLMAAGNTPILEWNMFNGFRTLSANIAVELPEAVKDSTHYRMLFLAALTLFILTFIINTIAETLRKKVRKRTYQL